MAVLDPGADANALFNQLTQDFNIPFPEIDLDGPEYNFPFDQNSTLYEAIPKLTTCDLTSGVVGGSGVFYALMKSVALHLMS